MVQLAIRVRDASTIRDVSRTARACVSQAEMPTIPAAFRVGNYSIHRNLFGLYDWKLAQKFSLASCPAEVVREPRGNHPNRRGFSGRMHVCCRRLIGMNALLRGFPRHDYKYPSFIRDEVIGSAATLITAVTHRRETRPICKRWPYSGHADGQRTTTALLQKPAAAPEDIHREPLVVTRGRFFRYCIDRLEDRRERKSLHISRQYGA
jgi:hypothetical protein